MSLVDVATPNPALFILPAKGEWGAHLRSSNLLPAANLAPRRAQTLG
jgi:hypothetical protein